MTAVSSDPTAPAQLQFRVEHNPLALKEAWLKLEAHATDPFCSYAWCSAWYESMDTSQGRRPYVVTGSNPDGELQMLLPLVQEKKMGMKVLARPARLVSGDYGGIVSPALRQSLSGPAMQSLWARMQKALRGIDALILNGVTARPDNLLIHLPHLPASAPAFSLTLESDWEEQYQRIFNTKMKRNDRRSVKRIHEAGTVEYRRPSDPQGQTELLTHLLEQKRLQIEASGEDHHLSRPEVQRFYHLLPRAFAESEAFDLALTGLALDDELIATSCGIAAKKSYFGMFMAMDGGPSRKFSPGRLLLLEINRHLCEQGIRSHEFGLGEYKYKDAWNCDRHERITVTAPTSLKGKLAMPLVKRLLEQRRNKKEGDSPEKAAPPEAKS